jgi:hypothetical protein
MMRWEKRAGEEEIHKGLRRPAIILDGILLGLDISIKFGK